MCGGRGERFPGNYPKPLNMVCGRMVGEWMIESLKKYEKIEELIWVLNPKLYSYDIEEKIKQWTSILPNIINRFIKLDFETRDPCETLSLAIKHFHFNENFVCIDNDNIYLDGLDRFELITYNNEKNIPEAAILVHNIKEGEQYQPRYGFVKISDNSLIIDGKEKIIHWGENGFSYGVYWFHSVKLCHKWLNKQRKEKEIIFVGAYQEKSLLNLIIKYSQKTLAIETKETFSIGTPEDCLDAELNKNEYFGWNQLNILKKNSFETFKNIDKTNTEYNILTVDHYPINLLPVTRNVSIKLDKHGHIIKSGPITELKGQAYYYSFLNESIIASSIKNIFPFCYNIINCDNEIIIDMEYIKGVPLSYLWCYKLFGYREWNLCIQSLNKIHNIKCDTNLNPDDVIKCYIEKVEQRRCHYQIYHTLDTEGELWNLLKLRIIDYKPSLITCIHGDSFGGNIIFTMKGLIKFIDMRGEINNQLTVFGDPNYDWAKLATTFLGLDHIVYNLPERSITEGLKWINKLDNSSLIINLALVLMYSSIPFYNEKTSSQIINRIQQILFS